MRASVAVAVASLLGIAAATPFKFPLDDGFPTPDPSAITKIQQQAGGTLSNAPPPPSLNNDTLTSFKLIAFNELFEVAFFTELLHNVTNNVAGYTFDNSKEKDFVLDALNAVKAQEELHTLNANGVLKKFNEAPIQPCQYNFPVDNFKDAVALANTFTDLVLGTLQDVQFDAANTLGAGGAGVVRAVSSVIGQEGEQNGFYRVLQLKRPSAQPFLTTSVRDFAFTALVGFTVPGSCPNQNTIPLKQFQPLTLLTPKPGNGALEFSTTGGPALSAECHSIAYINGQNLPVIKPIRVEDEGRFTADFPHDQFVMDGLTIAAVIEGLNATSVGEVAQKAIWAPGLIEVN